MLSLGAELFDALGVMAETLHTGGNSMDATAEQIEAKRIELLNMRDRLFRGIDEWRALNGWPEFHTGIEGSLALVNIVGSVIHLLRDGLPKGRQEKHVRQFWKSLEWAGRNFGFEVHPTRTNPVEMKALSEATEG